MKHLVTGGSGFLGNLISRRLHERGESVRILDVWKDPGLLKEIEYVQCDILNRDGVAQALKGIDVVHHNVALVPLTKSGKRFWKVNVEGSKILAQESVRTNVGTFIHMSSSAIYGAPEPEQCPIDSNTAPKPVEIYGQAKLAGETAVRQICDQSDTDLFVIRPRTILGAGRLGIFQILFEWMRESRNIYVIGHGKHLFQFVHANDLMDAYMKIVDMNKPGTYNVGTDRFGTLREALENLIEFAGSSSKVKSLPEGLTIGLLELLDVLKLSPLAPWHYLTYHKPFYFDVTPLLEMGWKAKYSNDEMLQESFQWFVSNNERLRCDAMGSPHRRNIKGGILELLKWLS